MSNRELRVSVDSNMEDLKKELASLRLDDESPRSRRGAWVVIALLVFIIAAGTIFSWGRGVFAATEVETTTPRVVRSGGAPRFSSQTSRRAIRSRWRASVRPIVSAGR